MSPHSSKIRVGVVGAGGRIGQELLKLLQNHDSMEPTLGIGRRAFGYKHNIPELVSPCPVIDVLIDFSAPNFFLEAIEFCIKNKMPLVSGTTGLSKDHQEKIKTATQLIPLLWAPNMSLGIAILRKALEVFKPNSPFDFQIEEWHHRHKKDSPSGTALFLQSALEGTTEQQIPPPMVMRAGGIYGVHKIHAVSEEEMISFEHTALNRTVFARGALVGARWLLNQKKNGFYTMEDVIS